MKNNPDLNISNVPSHITDMLDNISKNTDIARCYYVKPKILEMIERFPDEIKKGIIKNKKNKKRVIIPNMSQTKMEELQNIANYIGIDISNLLRLELYFITQKADDRIKKNTLDY